MTLEQLHNFKFILIDLPEGEGDYLSLRFSI